ncbi:hypothetical protein PLESTF_001739400 [Pleodorina starrii]|nr:hypothetical protein PLESTF_001739400 [Pleodorina starrii]
MQRSRRCVRVPEDKVRALEELVGSLEAAEKAQQPITWRQAAQVAGKIMCPCRWPSRSMAPLHARVIGLALAGKASWDEAIPNPAAELLRRARFFLRLLELKNGRTWWAKPPPLRLRAVGDASELGYGGLLPDGELGFTHLLLATAAILPGRAMHFYSGIIEYRLSTSVPDSLEITVTSSWE